MPSAEHRPISDDEAAALFASSRDRAGVALAVSGGCDSTALLHLWVRARAVDPRLPPATVLTVDHRLRPEAAEEARIVATLAARLGLPHRTLVRDGPKPGGNLQGAARRARYDLLFAATRAAGAEVLVTAHHAEDQAETFLARLARGSGVVGLAAMAPLRRVDGLLLLRPFLEVPKARLAATLIAAGQTWIEDPSNRDRRHERVRLRQAAPLLAELGLDRDRLTATARAMARAAAALDAAVAAAAAVGVDMHPAGWAVLRPDVFAAQPEEIRLRLLARLLRAVGGADYGPRLEPVEGLAARLATADPAAGLPARTLAGVRIEGRGGRIFLSAEAGRGPEPALRLMPGEGGHWRGRWVELAAEAPAEVTIARLGAEGRRRIAAAGGLRGDVVGDPRPSAATIESAPAIRVDGGLVACPGLGYEAVEAMRWGDRVRFVGGRDGLG